MLSESDLSVLVVGRWTRESEVVDEDAERFPEVCGLTGALETRGAVPATVEVDANGEVPVLAGTKGTSCPLGEMEGYPPPKRARSSLGVSVTRLAA